MTKNVKQHEKRYWHVPKFGLLPLLGILFFGFLTCANFLGILEAWKLLELGTLSKESITSFHQLLIMPHLLLEYVLVSGTTVSLAALLKGGYANLKPFDGGGLIVGLIVGPIVGLGEEFE